MLLKCTLIPLPVLCATNIPNQVIVGQAPTSRRRETHAVLVDIVSSDTADTIGKTNTVLADKTFLSQQIGAVFGGTTTVVDSSTPAVAAAPSSPSSSDDSGIAALLPFPLLQPVSHLFPRIGSDTGVIVGIAIGAVVLVVLLILLVWGIIVWYVLSLASATAVVHHSSKFRPSFVCTSSLRRSRRKGSMDLTPVRRSSVAVAPSTSVFRNPAFDIGSTA